MAEDTLVVPTEQEQIRQHIADSRASLTMKLELLEGKVAETVQSATATVTDAAASMAEKVQHATATVSETVGSVNAAFHGTVESVRHSVSASLDSVKETFDVLEHVRKHPWPSMAGAVVVGCVGGLWLRNRDHEEHRNGGESAAGFIPATGSFLGSRSENRAPGFSLNGHGPEAAPLNDSAAPAPERQGVKSSGWGTLLRNTFGQEIDKLQRLAIGTSLGMVRDVISDSVPQTMRDQLEEVIDGVTQRLGGDVIPRPVMAGHTGADDHLSSRPPFSAHS